MRIAAKLRNQRLVIRHTAINKEKILGHTRIPAVLSADEPVGSTNKHFDGYLGSASSMETLSAFGTVTAFQLEVAILGKPLPIRIEARLPEEMANRQQKNQAGMRKRQQSAKSRHWDAPGKRDDSTDIRKDCVYADTMADIFPAHLIASNRR
ncbi:hypothetical protein [Pseudomonas laurylsulfatiphila]|uniref:hypothetical protein n=1 Tax=Pseudomonas laurylsulfatiphila TaxID=2011015 RepID=UPI003D224297